MRSYKIFLRLMHLLPWQILKHYVIISFFLFIYIHRKSVIRQSEIDLDKLQQILDMHCSGNIIIFPYATIEWLWPTAILNEKIELAEGGCSTIGNELLDYESTVNNQVHIVDVFLNHLPQRVYKKLLTYPRQTWTSHGRSKKEVTNLRLMMAKTLQVIG